MEREGRLSCVVNWISPLIKQPVLRSNSLPQGLNRLLKKYFERVTLSERRL
jgi:hypothetical protein